MSKSPKLNKPNPLFLRKETKIKFKGRIGFGINGNTQELLKCLKEICTYGYSGRIILDFSEVDFFYPSSLNIIVVAGWYFLKNHRCQIEQIEPVSPDANNFLKHSGFCDAVKLSTFKIKEGQKQIFDEQTTYKIKNLNRPEGSETQKLLDIIETQLKISLTIRTHIDDNLLELLENVRQHSKSNIGAYIIGQAYPQSHRIRYCIGDAGIGIKKHLSTNYPGLLKKNSCEAIKLALQEGITGTKGSQNTGQGLFLLRELVKLVGGYYAILSDDGLYEEYIEYGDDPKKPIIKENSIPLDFNFHGTFIDIVLNAPADCKLFSGKDKIPEEFRLIR